MQLTSRCVERPRGGKALFVYWTSGDDRGDGGSSRNGNGPTLGQEVVGMEGGKTFVKIIDVSGDPERDDASLYGRWLDDGTERSLALTHEEFTAIKASNLPYEMQVEDARLAQAVPA